MRLSVILSATEGGEDEGFWATAYPIIPHPAEMIFGFVAFGILYWAVAKHVVPRLEKVFAERADAIEGGIARAEQAQAEAAAALERYRARLAGAEDEASRIREEARAEGARILADMREQARVEAERIVAAAQTQVQAERQQAMIQLRGEAGRIAVDLASRIVGEALEDEVRQRRVVDRFLAELEAAPAAEAGTSGGRG